MVTARGGATSATQYEEDRKAARAAAKAGSVWRTAVPFFIMWLTSPLLSLTDTVVVGRASIGKAAMYDVAALAPAASLADTASYLLSFVAIAVTTRVARASADGDHQQARATSMAGINLGLTLATTVALVIARFATPLLRMYTSESTSIVVPLARRYVLARVVGLPADIVWQVSQASSIARGDLVGPIAVISCACLINIALDFILICGFGQGVAGAALATTIATFIGSAAQYTKLKRLEAKDPDLPVAQARRSRSAPPPAAVGGPATTETETTVVKNKKRTNTNPSSFRTSLAFEAAPIFFVLLSKACSSAVFTAAAAGSLATLAAYQISSGIFEFLCPFGDAFASAAQALLPRALRPGAARPAKVVVRRFALETLGVAGSAAALAYVGALLGSSIFTTSPDVQAAVARLALPIAGSIFCYSVVVALEGATIAVGRAKRLGFLGPVNALVVSAVFLKQRSAGAPLRQVWFAYMLSLIFWLPQLAAVARFAPSSFDTNNDDENTATDGGVLRG